MLKCIVDDLNRGRKTAKVLKPDVYKSWLQTKAIAWLMIQEQQPRKSTLKNTTMKLFGSFCEMLGTGKTGQLFILLPLFCLLFGHLL